MLPVYKATTFINVIDKGSRTKPWTILADVDGTPTPYVVKLFDSAEINLRNSVVNEVLGSVLAREFDLPVPSPALIDFTQEFKKSLPATQQKILLGKDSRIKFGCRLMEGYMPFVPSIDGLQQLRYLLNPDTVFAYDYLIRNRDRGKLKPNILFRSDAVCIIDHELAFEIDGNEYEELKNYHCNIKFCIYHVFFEWLKTSHGSIRKHYFFEMEEYLKRLNVPIIQPYLDQLVSHGYMLFKHNKIAEYLTKMKTNSSTFEKLMQLSLYLK